MTARKVGYVISSLMVGVTLFACSGSGSSGGAVVDEDNKDNKETPSPEGFVGTKNLCVKQAANTFHCTDDTRFELCTGGDNFVVNSCPQGLCATRHPANKNPCVGADRAREIDGVPPTPPNQIDDSPPGNAGGANDNPPPTNNNGGQCVGGPKFDPAGTKNVGNGRGGQFIGGQCLNAADCASGCCALPCGICSGPGAQFQAGKQGCGFVAR